MAQLTVYLEFSIFGFYNQMNIQTILEKFKFKLKILII